MNELKQEAKSETTSPERLEELANLSHTLARIVAANPITPSELLEKLGRKRSLAIQKAVVSNPNTPIETLLTLGAKFPQQLLNNSVFNLLILENTDIIHQFPVDTLYNLLQQKNIPQFLLKFSAKHQNIEIAKAAKANIDFSRGIETEWRKIAEDEIASVNKAHRFENKLVNFSDFSEFLPLDVIALSSNRKLRQSIASNLNTPAKVLELLANDEDMYVRADVADNENTPVKILEKLAGDTDREDDDFWIHQFVGHNFNTPINVLEKLAKSKYCDVRDRIDRNHNRPTNIQEKFYLLRYCSIDLETINRLSKKEKLVELANSHNETVRQYIAKNPNTPQRVLVQLANNQKKNIREKIARNSNTPQYILKKLANDRNEDVRVGVASNSNIEIDILNKLALDKDDYVRNHVARNKKTSPEIIKRLCFDENIQVRYLATKSQQLAINILKQLAQDKDDLIRVGVAENINTSLDLLNELIKDNNIEVRCAAALNGNFDRNIAVKVLNKAIEELRQVDSSLNKDIRQSIAFDKNVPSIILENLIDDKDVVIRKVVAANPNTPVNILKQLAETEEKEEVIRAILKHPKCSINVKRIIFDRLSLYRKPSLARLTVLLNNYADSKLLARNVNSIYWLERYAIAQNAQTPTRTLKKLVEDANRIVRAAAIDNLSNR